MFMIVIVSPQWFGWIWKKHKGILGLLGGALCCVPIDHRALLLATLGAEAVELGPKAPLAASVAIGLAGSCEDLSVPTPTLTPPKRVLGVRVESLPFMSMTICRAFGLGLLACAQIFNSMGWTDVVLSKFMFL
jgi:hypothetical protein